ncbi:MAG: fumarylacetoacetase [Rhizobiaceae bacterium]
MSLIRSWVESANNPQSPFPVNNLALGVFSHADDDTRCGVAIGDMVFDCRSAEASGLLQLSEKKLFGIPTWNALMAEGPQVWQHLRSRLTDILSEGSKDETVANGYLIRLSDVQLHMPFAVSEYTDFYAGRNHATNVGTMFRGAENALPPNWLHIPIGYNGRASSVFVSGTNFNRPWGQLKSPNHEVPAFLPSRRFDFELEMGAIVGQPSAGPVTVQKANDMIFGYVLLNDWSARDIQAWEYQPLGPFQAKATATSISPWIIMKDALEPFKCNAPSREYELLDHLKDCGPMLYDIDLQVLLAPEEQSASMISRTNYNEMYYSSAQQLAHHTSSGCPMNVGDLLGSGTISGSQKDNRGSLLELSWGGKEPLTLDAGQNRTFLEDGDTVIMTGAARGENYTIGFGECTGKVLPALKDPYKG